MLLRVTFFLSLVLPGPCGAWADTIHLKNGRTILADHVRESGSRYEYEVGEDTYAIPKSSVDHVEAGGLPTHSTPAARAADL